ncbi:hypothetical protein BJY21_002643 [Kineosphaera limosa]|uniref:Uncharacterized protein n=1 Tax=Kineosphaera limosa NBRC 100340 TaxID=1184609 RepID=K6W7N5_9MICO|nr:sulfite exporter TauE/SafE family protein [Kineosphaera limosa]NYE01459.1 hypothetical protein [Kineosphaera limosa]GAB95205.1 hypothetical protein KILIM_017_00500 [Kineosphaera limosa NBRC 100340]
MLSSICPLGERARASRWPVTTGAYVLGSVAGGVALGTLGAGVGALVPTTWRGSVPVLGLFAALLIVGLLADLGLLGRALPSWRRQVDEQWLTRYRGWVYGVGFGVQLGFGVATIVPSATTYAVVVAAMLTGQPSAGAVIGATFGLVRALPVFLVARVEAPGQLRALFRGLQRWARPADVLAQVSLALAALVLMAGAVALI